MSFQNWLYEKNHTAPRACSNGIFGVEDSRIHGLNMWSAETEHEKGEKRLFITGKLWPSPFEIRPMSPDGAFSARSQGLRAKE
jgi:hypothetical protein